MKQVTISRFIIDNAKTPFSNHDQNYYNLPMIKRIYIEITNICDLHCPFCEKNHRTPESMEPSFFHSALSQAMQITPHIYLHVQGEPLLHPQFDEILSICDREHAQVHLVTNGSFLSRYPDLLNHSSLSGIAVSLQSAAARPSETIPDYFAAIRSMAYHASDLGTVNVDLRFWRSEGITDPNTAWCLDRLHEEFSFEETSRKNSYALMPRVYVSFANDFTWPSAGNADDLHGTCLGARTQLAVLCDGTVVPCCLDAEGQIVLGTLKTDSMSDILNAPRYQSMVQGFEQHRLVESLCRKCTYRTRFDY